VRLITTVSYLLCSAAIFASASAPAQQAGEAASRAAQSKAPLVQLWIDPGPAPRNLFDGPAPIPMKERPQTDGRFEVLSKDTAGFSTKLADRQLHDTFKAGNFSEDVAARYIARLRQKVQEGLALR
jgi:hypothetical protein